MHGFNETEEVRGPEELTQNKKKNKSKMRRNSLQKDDIINRDK